MNRRHFLKKAIASGAFIGSAYYLGMNKSVTGGILPLSGDKFDLVAIKGGEPDIMFEKAIQSLGGISQFVKKNQTVVVKPNIGWDVIPERGANTNPKLVYQIVKSCINAGAKNVYVFDNTCDNWKNCYKNSGIEKAVNDAGGIMTPGHSESYYQEVSIPNGKKLKSTKVHELILESDVFINVPVLKSHRSARVTIAMKNLMGIMWDRRWWHGNDLHQCIADFATYRKPDLNVIDAYNVMKENGPRGISENDIVTMKSLIISKDMVAADASATKLFGLNPDDVNYINYADEMKVGIKDLSKLNINRIVL